MKDIAKTEPAFYTEFIRENNPVHWEDIAPIREQLREHMLSIEQSYQCAYTEIRLESNNSSSHVDHFKRQGLFPADRFVYNNLFAADKNLEYGARHKDDNVEHNEYPNLLHPHHDVIVGRFKYNTGSGEIEVVNAADTKAQFTRTAFNLNHPILKERRKATTAMALAYKDQIPLEDAMVYIGEFESLVRYIYS